MEVLILSCLTVLLVYVLLRKRSPLDKVPGPKPLPLLGNVLQLDVNKLFIVLTDFAKHYGAIFKIHLFTDPVVVVNDYQFIQEVLVKQSANFAGRPYFYRGQVSLEKGVCFTWIDHGATLTGRRKAVQTFVKQFGSGIQKIEDVTNIAIDDLVKKFADQNGSPVDVRSLLFHCTTDITCILIVGETVGEDTINVLKATTEEILEALGADRFLLDMFPFLRFLGNKTYKQLIKTFDMKDKILGAWMDKRPEHGFINFLQSLPESEQKRFTVETNDLQSKIVWEFFLGGLSNTSASLSALLNILCHYQDVQDKLRNEVMDVIGPSRYPTLKDQDRLPYLQATILELGRFATVAPIAAPHKCMQTSTLGGFTIPKDTQVWVNLWSLHHDEKLWDEPFKFKPERFLDSEGKLMPTNHQSRKNVMPFGAGLRVCPGELLASVTIFMLTTRILQHFSIMPENSADNQPSCDPRDMKMGIVALPPPYKVRMMPRSE